MPVDLKEFMDGLAILADNHNLRVTVQKSGKGALICGTCCFIGGLVAGPVGLAIGGTVGGITAYKSAGHFRSLGDVIRNDLSPGQRERLYEHCVNTVRQIEPSDAIAFAPLLLSSSSVQQAVLKTVIAFVSNELKMQITS